ncbi:MAG TPA: PBSX family phage terminase large subunit [Oscillospiraceae bacterium]|nr:PBSX family phage terminase large subunit [Oscillospiraceae bacterium]
MPFSVKQQEFLNNANHRWNFKQGATRSGKTYLDYFVIPMRIRRMIGKPGLSAVLGVSKGTIQRNVIEPLQQIWGHKLVGDINSQNKCYMFGEWVYCLGAEKINQVAKLQGSSIKYCYGDEVARWNRDVFDMLKSRLDKPYSKFDGTCNPEYPTHWLKEFMDSDTDIYCQRYTIFDNPFLDKNFVEQLCKEYFGTVLYDRFILGEWKQAEGLCYPKFADSPKDYTLNDVPSDIIFGQIGIDFGGNGSGHAFQLTGFSQGLKKVITLEEHYHDNKKKGILSPTELERQFVNFMKMCRSKYKFPIIDVFADSAETTLIAGLKSISVREHLGVEIHNARKGEIIDRIRLYNSLIAQHRYFIMAYCKNTMLALQSALWNSKKQEDERLDDGTTNIDTLDAQEYSTENYAKDLMEVRL